MLDAALLKPGHDVFYLRGTEHVLATNVGLLSFPKGMAITYKCFGHTQLYRDYLV